MGRSDFQWLNKYKKFFRRMDKQKWIVCILIGILLLVIAIPVEPKEKGGTEQDMESSGGRISIICAKHLHHHICCRLGTSCCC